MPSIFVSLDASWPKTIYKKGPFAGRERERRRNTETRTEAREIEDWREKLRRALPVWSPSPPTTLPLSPWWRGSSPPLDFGFVAVAICISLFLVLHCFSAIWVAEHDYGHLCITFVVDLSISNIWDWIVL
jgi:hypothetical protein